MSVWAEVDALKRKAEVEFQGTVVRLDRPGVGKLVVDEYGVWKVRCTRSRGPSELITARNGAQLVERVDHFFNPTITCDIPGCRCKKP